jgi:hypothetical protein
MLTQLSPRSLLVVTLLAFSPAAVQAKGSAVSIGQSNPGTLDINRTIDPQLLMPQRAATTTPTTSSATQVLGVNGTALPANSVLLPNAGANGLPLTATNSGPPAATATNSGAIAAPSGTAVLGAMGRDMPECMAAWDTKTHITKSRWREICKSTLVEPAI